MRKLPIVTSGLIMMLALAGCGGTESPEDAQTTSPAQATETIAAPPATPEDSPTAASDGTPSPTEDSSPEPTPTEEQESGSPSQSTTDDPTGTEPTPNGVLSPEVKGQTLVLADFFNPDSDWTEGRYDVADQGSVSGVAREVSTCGLSDWAPTLELRLANNFDNMKFQVGQDNNSESSEQTLTVRVEGNGKQLDVQAVPFNEVQNFSVPVDGVNALKVQFYLDEQNENCSSGSVQAVIYDVELQ
ncbi:hypothetical protein [Kocuria marina]|uniref:hypothetical protein n=1 Tax=Kocuria marina TaxID=223184 RepID=UPI0022E69D03|nr:hypothetical protein [Kocuria marina]